MSSRIFLIRKCFRYHLSQQTFSKNSHNGMPSYTIFFKSVGIDASNTHFFPKRESLSPPIYCQIILDILLCRTIMCGLKKQH